MQNNYRHSFSFLFILNFLNISVPENAEPVINYSFGVFVLSLLVFFNILNAFLSLFSLYMINKYNVDENLKNYPWLKKIVRYYENSSLVFISIEIGMALIFTLVIIFSSLFFLGISFY
jgi:archaellum biogenesis protein FlaJ (TadC family)